MRPCVETSRRTSPIFGSWVLSASITTAIFAIHSLDDSSGRTEQKIKKMACPKGLGPARWKHKNGMGMLPQGKIRAPQDHKRSASLSAILKILQLWSAEYILDHSIAAHFAAAIFVVGCWQKRCRSKVLCRKGLRAFEARFSVLQFEPPASCDDGWMICKCARESVN